MKNMRCAVHGTEIGVRRPACVTKPLCVQSLLESLADLLALYDRHDATGSAGYVYAETKRLEEIRQLAGESKGT